MISVLSIQIGLKSSIYISEKLYKMYNIADGKYSLDFQVLMHYFCNQTSIIFMIGAFKEVIDTNKCSSMTISYKKIKIIFNYSRYNSSILSLTLFSKLGMLFD